MKISLSLIKQFIDIDLPCKKIADILTLAGVEVEKIENEKSSFSNIVVAEIISVKKHPNADKLCIAQVTDGKKTYQVVCGARNCREKLKTAFANIGSTLTDENNKKISIKKALLRDVESFGMLLSEKELSLSDESEGIIELPEDIAVGSDLSFLNDPVFEISLTPNLGHCMSALGIARELSAFLDFSLILPTFSLNETDVDINDNISVEILSPSLCPRYCVRQIEDIKMVKTPFWLQKQLHNCGMQSVNVVVDILNYVTLALGQPMHAFDYKSIDDKTIKVQKNPKEQECLCLDDQNRKVLKDTLLITDSTKPLAIAGIMGLKNSSITDTTTNIIIEAASFDEISIRKSCKSLDLRTESSMRFEKKIDPNGIIFSLNYACFLIQRICKGKVVKGIVDKATSSFPQKEIPIRISYCNKLLGTKLSLNEVKTILKKLNCLNKQKSQDELIVSCPTYRNDLSIEVDLIEEVGRIYGYNNIEKKPPYFTFSQTYHSSIYLFQKKLKNKLVQEGLQEFITCDLISHDQAQMMLDKTLPLSSLATVIYTKSKDQSVLRPSLLPSFLEVIKSNQDQKNTNISGFEISNIHFKRKDKIIEQNVFAIIQTGQSLPLSWDKTSRSLDFFDIKGIIENILTSFGIFNYSFTFSSFPMFHPGRQADILIEERSIGVIGEVHPNILSSLGIKNRVYFSEINIRKLFEHHLPHFVFSPLDIFPSSERDWTITLNEDMAIDEVLSAIKTISPPILEHVDIIDIFRDEKIGENKKNATFHFIYRDKTKTLSFEDVEKEHNRIITVISKEMHIIT